MTESHSEGPCGRSQLDIIPAGAICRYCCDEVNPMNPNSFDNLAETLAGFQFRREGDRWRVGRGPCAAVLARGPDGSVRMVEPPGYVIGGAIARLEDAGYQKFLVTSSARLPALAEHLREIHDFTRRLNTALGVTMLYNQSLGTVSNRYAYDRLRGRPRGSAS